MTVVDDTSDTKDNVSEQAPATLDDVHEKTLRELEDSEEDDGADTDSDTSDDTSDDVSDEDDSSDDDTSDEDTDNDEDEEQDDSESDEDGSEVVEPPQINTDIHTKSDDKIAIKNADGETLYFNSMDEIPDDFEPATYKELMRANREFVAKEARDAKALEEQQRRQAETEQAQAIKKIHEAWDADIASLSAEKILPEDEAKRQEAVQEVYQYMSKRSSEGVNVDSFKEAYKSLQYEKMLQEKKQQKIADKKARSSKVMSGAGGAPGAASKPEPIPPGATLDDIHTRYSGLV